MIVRREYYKIKRLQAEINWHESVEDILNTNPKGDMFLICSANIRALKMSRKKWRKHGEEKYTADEILNTIKSTVKEKKETGSITVDVNTPDSVDDAVAYVKGPSSTGYIQGLCRAWIIFSPIKNSDNPPQDLSGISSYDWLEVDKYAKT